MDDAAPPIDAIVSVLSQTMLNPAGMRIRMSLEAVIVTGFASVIVIWLIAVAGLPTKCVWFAADDIVAGVPPAAVVICEG